MWAGEGLFRLVEVAGAAATGLSPVVEEIRSSGALAFRPTAWGVWMVGTEAHPIGGDRLVVRVAIGPGCSAAIRSVGATVARRGPFPGRSSTIATVIRVGPSGSLTWQPEPGVASFGADHLSEVRVRLASDAKLTWRDEWVLGRHDEGPGTWRSRIRISVGARPLLVSELAAGPAAPGWTSRFVLRRSTVL